MEPLRIVVLKVGGEVAGNATLLTHIARAMQALMGRRFKIVLVHGGGPQATTLQTKLGIEPHLVVGRRVTDQPTLDVMKYVLAGQVNMDICAHLSAIGIQAIGLHGASSHLVLARRRPPLVMDGAGPDPVDLGLVGDVVGFNTELIHTIWRGSFVPIMGSLGVTKSGEVLNINADTVAAELAKELRAHALVLITSTPGVLRDLKDPTSRFPRLTEAEFQAGVADGTINSGMIPKIGESIAALATGHIGSVVVVGDLKSGELEKAVFEPGSVGTTLVV